MLIIGYTINKSKNNIFLSYVQKLHNKQQLKAMWIFKDYFFYTNI
jgi:hypothetical protein